jgi:hypothetical protein
VSRLASMLEQAGTTPAELHQTGLLQHAGQPISEPETALPLTNERQNARATQHRPVQSTG